jgi:hypothetical protein
MSSKLKKANQYFNYKTYDLAELQGPKFLENLGNLLDEAGKNGWDLVYMNEQYMILKQLYHLEN